MRGERGSGTVLMVGVLAALVLVAVGGLQVGAAVRAGHEARSAADLAALAGAQAWQSGVAAGAACAVSARLVVANAAVLQSCSVDGDTVDVSVTVEVRSGLPGVAGRHAEGHARAGPASPPGDSG